MSVTLSSRLVLTVLLLAATAWSQQTQTTDKKAPPADPCDSAQTQMEISNCQDTQARKSEVKLAGLYRQIQKAAQARMAEREGVLKSHEATVLEKLKTAQLAWTHYRDAQCDAAEQQFEGGTIAPSVGAGCRRTLAEQRIKELHDTYASYLLPQ